MKIKLLGRIGCLGGVAAVCAAAGLATGAPVASASEACSPITGSGSSLQSLAQQKVWSTDWTASGFKVAFESLECKEGEGVTYTATSSGKGEDEWGAATGKLEPSLSGNGSTLDEYIGTDVGPEGTATTGQIGNMNTAGKTKIVTIPVAQSAISVIVSLPEGCVPGAGTASVKNMALFEEWASHATTFSNLIGGVTLTGSSCSTGAPTLEARESPSGTTAGFKRYLNDLGETLGSKTFEACTATAAESESQGCWPSTVSETGNSTGGKLAEKVYETEDTIGYADLADARVKFPAPGTAELHKVGAKEFYSIILEVPNEGAALPEGGHIESPEGAEGAANCGGATYPSPKEVAANVDWSKAKQGNAVSGAENVYPICTLTFDVAWEKYKAVEEGGTPVYSEAEYHTTFNYLRWIVTKGQEGTPLTELKKAHFFGVPSGVKTEDEAGVKMTKIFWETSGK